MKTEHLKTIKLLLGLIAFGCLFWACEEDKTEDKPADQGCITGKITFFNTESIVEAYVQLLSKENKEIVYSGLINNTSGDYKIDNVEPGSYRFRVFKLGFIDTVFSDAIQIKSKVSNDGECRQMDWAIWKRPSCLDVVDATGMALDTLDYGASDDDISRSFNIFNNDSKPLNWKIRKTAEWISSVSEESGILKPGETKSIIVVINRKKLNVGENKTTMHIYSDDCGKQLTVLAIGRQYTLPEVKTLPITNLEQYAVTLHGAVLKKGDPGYIERGFVYGNNPMPTFKDRTSRHVALMATEDSLFHITIERMLTYSMCHIRAYAINRFDTVYSANEETFHGNPVKAEVQTKSIIEKSVSGRYVTVNAWIKQEGNPEYTECGFVYGTKPQPRLEDSDKKQVEKPIDGFYSATLNNLELNTTYYIRAYIIQEGKEGYGVDLQEKLVPVLPRIETSVKDKTDELTTVYADISGKAEPEYTEVGFLYGANRYLSIEDGTGIKVPAVKIGESKYMADIVGLTEGKTYYVCAYAHNGYSPIYGNVVEFKVENRYWQSFPEMGIMVQRNDLGAYTFKEAMDKCSKSKVGGFNDWRLPDFEELKFLYKNQRLIDGISSYTRWSSDSCGEENGDEDDGEENERQYKAAEWLSFSENCYYESVKHYVRAVRTIPAKK